MLTPINSIKHYVQQTLSTVTSGATSERLVASAVVAPAASNTFDVTQGSVIKAVYIELWLIGAGSAGVNSSFQVNLEKRTNLTTSFSITNANNLGSYENKKNILYTTQGIVASEQGSGAVPVMRGWLKVPKGKQRMGLGDELAINISALAVDIQICGFFTYKEYR